MRLFQIRDGQAQITFSGRQGTVAEQVLVTAQAGMVLDKVRRALTEAGARTGKRQRITRAIAEKHPVPIWFWLAPARLATNICHNKQSPTNLP